MANIGDILIKYKEEYPTYHTKSVNRLNSLKRSFSNEKENFITKKETLDNQLLENQKKTYKKFDLHHQNYTNNIQSLEIAYQNMTNEFNEDIYNELKSLDDHAENEHLLFEEILEDFEARRQDAFTIYLDLTKNNNDEIDQDMKVHHEFIKKEKDKLNAFKSSYDNLNAKLNNKLLWTIEKSKNAISQLENNLTSIEKDDLFSLNKKIIQSLSDMRGTRNDINVVFKESSALLQDYKEDIYKIRKVKQRPYTDINQKVIQKLVKQIRLANDNKTKYQNIINSDLKKSKEKLYPLILKANENQNKDELEKYILQTEALEQKANFLIEKINKITNYNISNYQKRIKEIKIEAFTRNEEIKNTYSVPMKFIENSVNIYSNYNFYFNQGFNDLDKLLTQLIDFSQVFNDIRYKEILTNKKDFSDYQNTLLAKITEVSEKLSELLCNIDEIAFEITTLESKYRLKIADIKKEILNVDIKGDYFKYIESLNTDYEIANNHYKNRLKKINIHKLYKDKLLDIYKTSTDLNRDIHIIDIDRDYNQEFIKIETNAHRDIFDNLSSQLDNFYTYQTKLSEIFMKMMKEKVSQSVKATNYHLVNSYNQLLNNNQKALNDEEDSLVMFIKRMQKYIKINNRNAKLISTFIDEKDSSFSLNQYFKQSEDKLLEQITYLENKKTASLNHKINQSFIAKKKITERTKYKISDLLEDYKQILLSDDKNDLLKLLERYKFTNTIHQFTLIYYDVLNYLYQYSANPQIKLLNDYYDDFIIEFTENFTRTLDKVANYKKDKRKINTLYKYLIFVIDELNDSLEFMNQLINKAFDSTLDKLATQLAIIKININKHKSYVLSEYSQLDAKSKKLNDKVESQQKLINQFTYKLNKFITSKVINKNKQFLNKKDNKKQLLSYLEKKITRIIKHNDKELLKLLKHLDNMVAYNYDLLLKDYEYQKYILNQQLQKMVYDSEIEEQYNSKVMDAFKNNIVATRNQLLRQLEILPTEKQTRLSSIELDNQKVFDKHYDKLMKIYTRIEKDKFAKKPILERKIELEENEITEQYSILYEKHKSLEDNYLNQYIHFNDEFKVYHKHFKDEKIEETLRFDHDLNQPLTDLLDTQSSLIDITRTIHKETSLKTQSKINEINDEKSNSEKKQSRIINS